MKRPPLSILLLIAIGTAFCLITYWGVGDVIIEAIEKGVITSKDIPVAIEIFGASIVGGIILIILLIRSKGGGKGGDDSS